MLGIVGTGRFAAGTLALLAVTLLIDSSAGRFVILAVAVIATVSAFAISGVRLPAADPQKSFGMAEALRILREQPVLRQVTLAQILYGAGIVSAGPLIAMVYVDQLGLGMSEIALAGLSVYAATALAFGPAGRLANRIGGLHAIALGSILSAGSLIVFAVAPNLAGVLLAAVLLGVSSAAVNVSWPLILAEHASLEQQASVAAGMATIMGARGLVAPFLLMLPVSAGLIGVAGGLLVCVVLSASGALIYARAAGVRLELQTARRASYVRTLITAMGAVGTLIRF